MSPGAGEFADDVALAPAGGGDFAGEIRPRWNVGTAPNGGYLMAMAANAMLTASGRPDPLSVTAHYASPPEPGPVTVATETVRAGRRYATLAARMLQGEHERVRLLGAVGDLDTMTGPTHVDATPPEVEPPERCVPVASWRPGEPLPEFLQRYDLRLPQPVVGSSDDQALRVAGWIRFSDGAPPSVLALLAFCDAFPPSILEVGNVGWVPTIELTVHVRARPAPGWVMGAFRTRVLVDGLLEEDGELWGADGRLLAQSRQLALVLPRRSTG